MLIAALNLPPLIDGHLRWIVAAVIVVAALLLAGPADLGRLVADGGWKRAWAISSVCFAESIRRRVLWITPLAIVGVIVAVQLLQPLDEQDAIRQTIKYALFATGVLVVLATIILACTNLPKEIDNRVIYTVVTKPATRLEIVLGKIAGFARVSATLLVIMGLFTLAYAGLRASHLQRVARQRLETMSQNDSGRPSLEHYVQYGLLQSKQYARPVSYQSYALVPKPDDAVRWVNGSDEQSVVYAFDLPPEMLPEQGSDQENGGLVIVQKIQYADLNGGGNREDWHPTPFPGAVPDPNKHKVFSLSRQVATPTASVEILGPNHFNMVPLAEMQNGGSSVLESEEVWHDYRMLSGVKSTSLDRLYQSPPERRRRIYVKVVCTGPLRYGFAPDSIVLLSPRMKELGRDEAIFPVKGADGKIAWPDFRGREVTTAQQLRGGADLSQVSVGVFSFRGAALAPDGAPLVPMEFRAGIEGSGDEISERESITHAVIEVVNLKTGQRSAPKDFPIESNRTAFFEMSADYMSGGDFDVYLRCLGPGHYLVLHTSATTATPSLQMVVTEEAFALNLVKSLGVMWLMSLLVVIVAIFCSTFVSWPIAVVLTGVILIGHWGAQQIGDSNAPGLGAQMAKDLGLRDPATMKTFGSAVDSLSKLLNTVSKWLPDIGQFAATEDIERGVTIAPAVLIESVKVILLFGVPLAMLSYLFLKRKEVAP